MDIPFLPAFLSLHRHFSAMKKNTINIELSDAKELVALRKRATKGGGYSLYLDYYIYGQRCREFLKMYLIPEKSKIDHLQNLETVKAATALKAKRVMDIQNGVAGLKRRKGEKVLLLDYMEERQQYYTNRGSETYAQTVKNCGEYCQAYKGKNIRLSQINEDYITGFIGHLNDSKLGTGTIYTYYNALMIVLNSAVREGLIAENPAKYVDPKIKPKQKESSRDFLTLDELRQLTLTPCAAGMLKKAFLFSCFTGLRVSDICVIRKEDIVEVDKGKYQIQIAQKKTKSMVFIPLSDNALKWMPQKKSGLLFPEIPPSPTRERKLAEWSKAAKIKKHVTFHVARHTYATLLLTYGADIYTVSQLLGHKNLETTQIYAKIIDEKKRETVDLIPQL